MLIRLGIAIGLATVFIIGYSYATGLPESIQSSNAAIPQDSTNALANEASDEAHDQIIATAYSKRCATASGICTLDKPQKVGARCSCKDGTRGTVVR